MTVSEIQAEAAVERSGTGRGGGGRGWWWLLVGLVVAVGALVALGVVNAVRGPALAGEELTPPELVELAEGGRLRQAVVLRGHGRVTGEYVRRDGSVGVYQMPLGQDDQAGDPGLLASERLLQLLLAEQVPTEIRHGPSPALEWVALAPALVAWAAGLVGLWLMRAWRRGSRPFRLAGHADMAAAAPAVAAGVPGEAVAAAGHRDQAPGGVAALVCGIAGWVVPVPLVLPVLAVVAGLRSRRAAAAWPWRYTDDLGKAGRVVGWIGIIVHAMVLLALATFAVIGLAVWANASLPELGGAQSGAPAQAAVELGLPAGDTLWLIGGESSRQPAW